MSNSVKTICIDCGKEKEITKRSFWRIKVGGRSGRCLKCAIKLNYSDPEYKRKLSLAMKGHAVSEETRRKIGNAHRGKVMSEEAKRRIGLASKGREISKETRMKLRLKSTGRKHTKEAKHKISKAKEGKLIPSMTGKNHYRWIENRTQVKTGDRFLNDPLQKQWRKEVKNRDGWKCMISDKNCSGKLEAHHILPWSQYPQLRYETKNGITLCHYHHPRKGEEVVKLAPYFQRMVGNFLAN